MAAGWQVNNVEVPFRHSGAPPACHAPPVTEANLQSITRSELRRACVRVIVPCPETRLFWIGCLGRRGCPSLLCCGCGDARIQPTFPAFPGLFPTRHHHQQQATPRAKSRSAPRYPGASALTITGAAVLPSLEPPLTRLGARVLDNEVRVSAPNNLARILGKMQAIAAHRSANDARC